MTADISLRGPGDVVAALPYQLGYHPAESVVLVCLLGRRVCLVARCDLPADGDVGPTAAALLEPVLREDVDGVVLVGYESEPEASHPLLLELVASLEAERVHVVDVAVVRGGRRYSPTCSEPCCPPGGVPLPEPADVPAVAELVGLGRSPLGSRAAVAALVEPDPQAAPAVGASLGRRQRPPRVDVAVRAWGRVLDPPPARSAAAERHPRWPPGVVAAAVGGLADVPLRDALVGWLAPGVLPAEVLDPGVVARLERTLPRWAGMGYRSRPAGSGAGPGPVRGPGGRRCSNGCSCCAGRCPTAARPRRRQRARSRRTSPGPTARAPWPGSPSTVRCGSTRGTGSPCSSRGSSSTGCGSPRRAAGRPCGVRAECGGGGFREMDDGARRVAPVGTIGGRS